MEKRERILEKLRKLINLKESAIAIGSKGEVNAAAAGITRLLMEYNLSEEDIPEQEKLENPVISEEIPYKSELSNGAWYETLVSIVCEYNMCKCLIINIPNNGRLKRTNLQIIGRKKNVEIVLYLISFLAHQFVTIGKHNYIQYKQDCVFKYGIAPKTITFYLKSFLYGCVIGLKNKFDEIQKKIEEETNITALALTTKGEIDEFLKDQKIGKARNSKSSIDGLSVSNGISVGKNIEICKGLYAERVSEDKLLQ